MWFRGAVNAANANLETTFTFAGQVVAGSTASIEGDSSWWLRSNPFPKTLELNGTGVANWSSVLTPGTAWSNFEDYEPNEYMADTAPQIQFPSADGQKFYYYVSDVRLDDEAVTGWCDGSGEYVADIIPVGQGWWFNARSAETVEVEFTK